MSELLDRVRALKEKAKARTASADRKKRLSGVSDYSEAVGVLNEAVGLLLPEVGGADSAATKAARSELAGELADCYGMLGGVQRRAGNLAESVRAYEAGREYEMDDSYDVQNSYNLTNSIAVGILKDPDSLADQRPQLEDAVRVIERQVGGKRRDQWWAWSDLGELRLLCGRAGEAREAYLEFKKRGPGARHFESTISVLRELAEAVVNVDQKIAEDISAEADFLLQNKPLV